MHLILFGLKYSGKTHFGKLLSRRLSYDFLETDRLIEKQFYKRNHQKLMCREIYKELGEELFRTLEREVIHHLKYKKNSIIAVGGGAALDARNMLHLSKIGTLVYLKTPKEILQARMLSLHDTPAYLSQHKIEHSFDEMFTLRESIYSQIPSIHLDTENKQEEEILVELELIIKQTLPEQNDRDIHHG
jgi:shikimate kinase